MKTIKIVHDYNELFSKLNLSEKEIEILKYNLVSINIEKNPDVDLQLIKIQSHIEDSLNELNKIFIQMFLNDIPFLEYDEILRTILKFKILCPEDVFLSDEDELFG